MSLPAFDRHGEEPRVPGDAFRPERVVRGRRLVGHSLGVEERPRRAGADGEIDVLRKGVARGANDGSGVEPGHGDADDPSPRCR